MRRMPIALCVVMARPRITPAELDWIVSILRAALKFLNLDHDMLQD